MARLSAEGLDEPGFDATGLRRELDTDQEYKVDMVGTAFEINFQGSWQSYLYSAIFRAKNKPERWLNTDEEKLEQLLQQSCPYDVAEDGGNFIESVGTRR